MSALPPGWARGDSKYFIDHESGRWRISLAIVKEKRVYTLWKKIPRTRERSEHWSLYGNHDSAAEADQYRINSMEKRT